MNLRTLLLTITTMSFFAANSLLARLALRDGAIDGASFTAIRLAAGAAALALVLSFRKEGVRAMRHHGSLRTALALFAYAIAFSFAYTALSAGTGALVLFAAVQITMLSIGIARGERPPPLEWLGLATAVAGLVYLVSPGLAAPSPAGVMLMAVSGAAWGYYSLAAKSSAPIASTAGNFARAVPMAAAIWLILWIAGRAHANAATLLLAALSGAITSGFGYVLWSIASRDLRASRAAIVQLTVPALAASAGVVLLGEPPTLRLLYAGMAILSGVAMALLAKQAKSSAPEIRRST